MRFLFGILTGAALTLLIATTTNAPTSPVVEQVSSGWGKFIHTTGNLLFRKSQSDQPVQPPPLRLAGEKPDRDAMREASATDSDDSGALPADEPVSLSESAITPIPVPQPTPETPRAPTPWQIPAAEVADAAFSAEQAAPPEQSQRDADSVPLTLGSATVLADSTDASDWPDLEANADTEPSSPQVAAVELEKLASVWTPFHSERSAEGFANRLSEYFTHPFSVQRQGPGEYQVTFPYDSEAERESMLMELAEITGR